MKFLEKEIEDVVLIDLFKEEERLRDTSFVVSQPLKVHLDKLNIPSKIYFQSDPVAFQNILEGLASEQAGPLILQISGHGRSCKDGFGNDLETFWILWEDFIKYLPPINKARNGGLILNLSMMCFSEGLIDLTNLTYKPYHATITSNDKRSFQSLYHNKIWYEKSQKGQDIRRLIIESNNALETHLGYKPYKIDMHVLYA